MSTVLRFWYSGGGGVNTDFDTFEVAEVKKHNVQKTYTWLDLQRYYHQYYIGVPYQKLEITFNLAFMDTWTNLETLFGYKDTYYQPAVLKCYYEYSINTASVLWVQMKRDDFKYHFFKGYYKGGQTMTLKFFETTPPGTAVVSTKIIGV